MRQQTLADEGFECYRKPTRRDQFLNRSFPGVTSARSSNRFTLKLKVRAKVEHPLLVFKRIFGFSKVRYRGLDERRYRVRQS